MRWQYTDPDSLTIPIVSPLNDLFSWVARTTANRVSSKQIARKAACCGRFLYPENGLNVDPYPFARARFTPDGQTAYIGTSIAGQPSNGIFLPVQHTNRNRHRFAGFADPESHYGQRRTSSQGTVTLEWGGPNGRSGREAGKQEAPPWHKFPRNIIVLAGDYFRDVYREDESSFCLSPLSSISALRTPT